MKARVKATGEIVEVRPSEYKCDMQGENETLWTPRELEFEDTPDYWDKLLHQYAGMAMQGILTNPIGFENIRARGTNIQIETALLASEFAHALVERLKEEQRHEDTGKRKDTRG